MAPDDEEVASAVVRKWHAFCNMEMAYHFPRFESGTMCYLLSIPLLIEALAMSKNYPFRFGKHFFQPIST